MMEKNFYERLLSSLKTQILISWLGSMTQKRLTYNYAVDNKV